MPSLGDAADAYADEIDQGAMWGHIRGAFLGGADWERERCAALIEASGLDRQIAEELVRKIRALAD